MQAHTLIRKSPRHVGTYFGFRGFSPCFEEKRVRSWTRGSEFGQGHQFSDWELRDVMVVNRRRVSVVLGVCGAAGAWRTAVPTNRSSMESMPSVINRGYAKAI